MFDRQVIRHLAEYPPEPRAIVSFFLDIDGARYRPIHIVERTHQLVREARTSSNGNQGLDNGDLDRITRFMGAELDRGAAKGVAVYSCQERGLWHVVLTPQPLQDRIVVSPVAALRPLIRMFADNPDFGLVLVDRDNARIA